MRAVILGAASPASLAAVAPSGEVALFFLTLFVLVAAVKAFVGLAYAHLSHRPARILLYQLGAGATTFVPLALLLGYTSYLATPVARGAAELLAVFVEGWAMSRLAGRALPLRSALALAILSGGAVALVGLLASAMG